MKTTRLLFSCFVLLAVTMWSCQRDNSSTGSYDSKSSFKLSLDVDGLGSDLATRATIAPEVGEDQMQSLTLLFFEASSDGTGLYKDYVNIDGPFTMNLPVDVVFDPASSLDGITDYNILAVANIDNNRYVGLDIDDWCNNFTGKTQNAVYDEARGFVEAAANLISTNEAGADNSRAIPMDALIMSGTTTKSAGDSEVYLTLIRGLSRFDVINSTRENYNLVSVSVWNAFPEMSVWGGGVIDYSLARNKRFYGLNNTSNEVNNAVDPSNPFLGDVVGGLYAFENLVASPGVNDELTTCLIVGLQPRAGGAVSYYRMNIHPTGSSQALKRNNVYKVTIRSVLGPGAATEADAYGDTETNLNYVINYWDLDDDGLIVQDGQNLLAIPTKTVKLDPDGEVRELTIFTFGTGNLAISQQIYESGGNQINASLTGNTLIINAQPLGAETERKGIIELSFAGLKATINVIQSGATTKFLTVTTPSGTGTIPAFGPFGGLQMQGAVKVEASGPWTATIYMDGFTFLSGSNVRTMTSDQAIGGQFTVSTYSANPNNTPREAFIIIKLDEDPDNYNSVILLTQKPTGGIAISPANTTVTFDGSGTLATGVANNVNLFNVSPGSEGTPAVVNDWTVTLSGANADKFNFSKNYDAGNEAANTVTFTAVGANDAASSYTATARIALDADATKYVDINLVQRSRSFTLNPSAVQAVPAAGGETQLITVNGDTSLDWTHTITTTTTTSGATLDSHEAYLVDESGNTIAPGTVMDMSDKFKVVFPKIMYGNHKKTVQATVTITLDGTAVSSTLTVNQTPLTPRAINILNTYGSWGNIVPSLGDNYFAVFRSSLQSSFPSSAVPDASFSMPSSASQSINDSYTYIHANYYSSLSSRSSIETWRANDRGCLVIVHDPTTSVGFNDNNGTLGKLGWSRGGAVNASNARWFGGNDSRKIKQFLLNGPFGTSSAPSGAFGYDATSSRATIPTGSAVVIFGESANTGSVIIDPANRLVYIGESQMFGTTAQWASYRTLLSNLQAYIMLTAQYGSAFSDLYVD